MTSVTADGNASPRLETFTASVTNTIGIGANMIGIFSPSSTGLIAVIASTVGGPANFHQIGR